VARSSPLVGRVAASAPRMPLVFLLIALLPALVVAKLFYLRRDSLPQ